MLKIYSALHSVLTDVSKIGIGKARGGEGTSVPYRFRGIDDVYNVMSTLFSKHKLIVIPRSQTFTTSEHTTRSGGTLTFTRVAVKYSLIALEDGSSIECEMLGEGMDSGDKSLKKALSAAFCYLLFETFCIPVEGMGVDSEEDNPEPSMTLLDHNSIVRDWWSHIEVIKTAIATDDLSTAVEAAAEMPTEVRLKLNLAPTKGGIFTTNERAVMRSDKWGEMKRQRAGELNVGDTL